MTHTQIHKLLIIKILREIKILSVFMFNPLSIFALKFDNQFVILLCKIVIFNVISTEIHEYL